MKIQTLTKSGPDGRNPQVYGIRVLHLPASGKQNFRGDWLENHRQFVTRTDDRVILHTVDGDFNFKIDFPPGRHCLTCGEQLQDAGADPYAEKCRDHVAEHGADAVKTERWPHGYIASKNTYFCTLEN